MTVLETALAHHQSGNLKRAIKAYKQHLRVSPNDPVALSYMSLACFETGRFPDARKYLTRKLATSGGDAELFNLLGLVETRSGNPEAAISAFRRAIEVDGGFAKAWNNLGSEYRKAGELPSAIDHYARACRLDPGNSLALENLADCHAEVGDEAAALAAYQELSRRRPEAPRLHGRIAELLSETDPTQAELRFREAMKLEPANPERKHAFARFLAKRLRHDEALRAYDELLAADPDDATLVAERAEILKALGKVDTAEAAYRRAFELSPDRPRLLSDIAALKTFQPDDPDIAAMEAHLIDPAVKDRDRRSVNFGLAKAYGDVGDTDRAFSHLREANRLRRAEIDYDVHDDLRHMKNIERTFTECAERLSAIEGNADPLPIFILGMPRSGTSLVEQILASHPEVHGGGENLYFPTLVQRVRVADSQRARYPDFLKTASPAQLQTWISDAASGFLDNLRAKAPDAARVTDKLPLNFMFLGLIAVALPKARIVHCVRDPIDTCFSCYQQEFTGALSFAWDLEELGRFYRGYQSLMAFWHDQLGGRVLDVSYEDLIADQENQTRRLLDFCDLPWAPECLSFHENDRVVATASFMQVKKPIYQTSKRKWAAYAAHLKPLIDVLEADPD